MIEEIQQQAEEALFSHLKHNINAASGLNLPPDCFSSGNRANIFSVLQQCARQNLPYDRKLIKEQLQRKGVELEDQWWNIFDHSLPSNEGRGDQKTIEHYANILKNCAVRMDYVNFLEQYAEAPLDMRVDLRQIMQQHMTKIAGLQDKVTLDVDPSVEAIMMRSMQVNPNPFFPSGMEAIDRNVKGLRAGHMWVLSAPYKGRKTSTALNIVEHQLRNDKAVMYIALEDDDQAFLDKLIAIWGKIPHDEVIAYTTGGEDTERVRIARAEVAKTKLRIYDAKKHVHNWKNLPALINSDRMRFGQTDLVVVDYVQAYSVSYEVLQEIVPMLLKTAAEQSVCMLVLSQMNNVDLRNQRFNSPGGQDGLLATKGTGDFGAACHVGLEISRDLQIPGELMLSVKIARNGQAQRTFCQIDESSGKIVRNDMKARFLVNWDQGDIDEIV